METSRAEVIVKENGAGSMQWAFFLYPAEVGEMVREIRAVVEKYRGRVRE